MPQIWRPLINFIDTATEGNFSKSGIVSEFHDSALFAHKSIPIILTMYNTYHPIHLNMMEKLGNWKTQGGIKQGESLSLSQLFIMLRSTKIKLWDISIQNVYTNTSSDYKTLLPNHRIPFQTGKQFDKITEVKSLSQRIGTNTLLVDTKDDIDLFYTQLKDAYDLQKGGISSTSDFSQQMEVARLAMCVAQFSNYGELIHQYASDTSKLVPYFDIANLHKSPQVLFTHTLKALQDYCLFKHTFGKDDEVAITNPNAFPLKFFKAALKTNKIDETFYVAPPEAKSIIKAAEIGNLDDKFMKVFNPNEIEEAHFEFEIL